MDTAIIGISCRLPDAGNHHEFWRNLVANQSAITEIPQQRWAWDRYWGDPKAEINKSNSKWGGFIDDVDAFDNEFFELLPKVVKTMDPQQRIMLELSWACIEDAGIAPASLSNRKVGVIFGVFNHDYKELQESRDLAIEAHHSTGTAASLVANRVSHFFNFRGPSFPVDTACSSSLNAIHSAIQAMQSGDCEMALAGGINLYFTPTRHISFSKMGMLSPTGSCKSFDASADGYVRGEGAGVILLKPLDRAVADGDPIYGVIKGTAVNHCGKTYNLTAPSAQAQSEVIAEAVRRADVPIDSLSYIEAHGTGTPKGDPIEFEGLRQAFATVAREQGVDAPLRRCALGSVKSNIGHLEAAAGIAGLIKVIMALQAQKLPALHHFSSLNPRIDADATPFYFLDALCDWERPLRADGRTRYPLRAGVSSFGFGGTNAHLILEEPPQAMPSHREGSRPPACFVALSAKTRAALERKRNDLLAWLHEDAGQTPLLDISATLLTGRDHQAWRCGFVVSDREELLRLLSMESGQEGAPARHQVRSGDNDELGNGPVSDVPHLSLAELDKGGSAEVEYVARLQELCAEFLRGSDVDWRAQFQGYAPARVRLPTYPFAKTRFWIDPDTAGAGHDTRAQLHPLLHNNVSDLSGQRFETRFDGSETVLADHRIKGEACLPGVAYLELAGSALMHSLANDTDIEDRVLRMRDIVWMRPLVVTDPTSVTTRVMTAAAGIEFEVADAASGAQAERIYCRGTASLEASHAEPAGLPAVPSEATRYDAEACYTALSGLGFDYGDAYRSIAGLRLLGGSCEADLKLPNAARSGAPRFRLHPSMMDGALQAAVLLVSASDGALPAAPYDPVEPYLPFALDDVTVHAASGDGMKAVVRFADGYNGAGEVKKVDIDIVDEKSCATVVVRMRGLQLRRRIAAGGHARVEPAAVVTPSLFSADNREGFYTPQWLETPVTATDAGVADSLVVVGAASDVDRLSAVLAATPALAAPRLIKVCCAGDGTDGVDHHRIRAAEPEANAQLFAALKPTLGKTVWVLHAGAATAGEALTADGLRNGLDTGVRELFVFLQGLMKQARRARIITLVDARADEVQPVYQGLSGFFKTLKIEKPGFDGRVVLCAWRGDDTDRVSQRILQEFTDTEVSTDVVYRNDSRRVRGFVAAHDRLANGDEHGGDTGPVTFRDGGVYLITGGMGALGLIFARHICAKYRGTVYLTGRSALDDDKQRLLGEVSASGGTARYIRCDVVDADGANHAAESIRADGLVLNGVIHSAGVIDDAFILRKSLASFDRVIAPKTYGTYHLDCATRDDPLDFFVLFSSVTGVLGNIGQCDYGFGNAFEDYYSLYRNRLSARNERSGKTLSVNWPYWRNGGMTLTDKEEEVLRRNFGIVALENENGVHALEVGLQSPLHQLAVLEAADQAKVHQVLGVRTGPLGQPDRSDAAAGSAAIDAGDARGKAFDYLADLFAAELSLSRDRFEPHASFQQYGFDSVVMIDMVHVLENRFAGLPKTLFFEYQTLDALAGFLVENYAHEFSAAAAEEDAGKSPAVESGTALATAAIDAATRFDGAADADDRIAIIGLSGRYPDAEDLAEFWDNLKAGRDCIREVPTDRWSMDKMFQPGAAAPGKSYAKWGGFIEGIDRFDPLFFSISPREAELMDPHERLFLETVNNTIADAGYHPEHLARPEGVKENPVGVYVGVMWGDYHLYGVESEDSDAWTNPRSFYWGVANRVSYFFNFSGPSITVDTACSSSLTAIHLACEALKRGEIQTAIAGGVNLTVHPQKYHMLANMQFLSSDGRCRSFGEGGDGYVPGEGVGAVVLKPLSAARRDGDHIYGIIRGSALNHGGRTSGFTVPNPNRQAALIREALERSHVNPRHVSYLEAHGTGTSLGDPIELTGLTKAYEQADKQYCSIGSAKSNIGHLEASAGIAGLTKVLLQMKHRTLVPSLHSATLNPYIDFANSPFFVQQDLGPWNRPSLVDVDGRRELPRIAGISSFGAGGANAHLIVEEYPSTEPVRRTGAGDNLDTPVLITLSARRAEGLKQIAAALAQHIDARPDLDLGDVAFTLQTGRMRFDRRLAVITDGRADLSRKLRAYSNDGAVEGTAVRAGSKSGGKDSATRTVAVDAWLAEYDLAALAAHWVDGRDCDWRRLRGNDRRRRVSLPGYVYDKQSYWTEKPAPGGTLHALHALLDRNVSTLDEQVFEKQLDGNAFYLRDHRLGEAKVLPGVAYLEMAVQAARLATRGEATAALRDIRWLKPVVVDDTELTVRIALAVDASGLGYRIYALDDDRTTAFADGRIELDDGQGDARALPAPLQIDAFKARAMHLDRAAIDAGFAALGFAFGPSFRVFEELHYTDDEALGSLRLDAEQQQAPGDFVLHPALLDGALRTALAIGGLGGEAGGLAVPVRLDRIEILHALSSPCFAHARAADSVGLQPNQRSFDITVYGAAGEPLVVLSGLLTQTLTDAASIARPKGAPKVVNERPVSAAEPLPPAMPPAARYGQNRHDAVSGFLIDLIARATKIPADQIDPRASFDSYGIDSIIIMGINEALEATFGEDVSKTLFFEYRDLEGLIAYFLEDHVEAIDAKLVGAQSVPAMPPPAHAEPADGQKLHEAVQRFLAELVADVTKVPLDQIDAYESFENYGIDSVMILKVNETLEQTFGEDVSKTLFFEFGNLFDLAAYLAEEYPQEFQSRALKRVGNELDDAPGAVDETQSDRDGLRASLQHDLLQLINGALARPQPGLSAASPLADLDLDAVALTGVVCQLRKRFAPITVNAIYQHTDVASLADYLLTLPQSPAGDAADYSPGAELTAEATRSAATGAATQTAAPGRFSLQANRFGRLAVPQVEARHDDIAIVGLSGRYPQSDTLDAYWYNLVQGRDCITEIPASRWDHDRYFDADRNAKETTYSKWGGFLGDIDQFDAQFFNISRREAEILDPQMRNYLHTAWECLEDAAYTRRTLRDKSVGVFVGVMWGHYDRNPISQRQLQAGRPYVSYASVANRVSYFFDFHGPSVAMDTMCSSSLTAIHQACLSIRNGDCDVALAGGINLHTHPLKYLLLAQGQFLASDGRCRSFGDGGDGYVPGEGVGAAFLKPLGQAVKDGDRIYGVIKASALNHGGRTHGYTVPNQPAQTNVIGQALDRADWAPESVDYIEAHGTGTPLGDPIEVAALTKAFARRADKVGATLRHESCRIGSVKSNVGHLESAAGIAALTKVLLQMRHKTIAPSLHSADLNPNINFSRTPFRVVQQAEAWEQKFDSAGRPLPRRAGISSFGAGGSNAHLLIEEYVEPVRPASGVADRDPTPRIFVLSADSPRRLDLYVDRMVAFLEQKTAAPATCTPQWYTNLVYTSQVGRELMAERIAVIAGDAEELLSALRSHAAGDPPQNLYRGSVAKQVDRFENILDQDAKNTLVQGMLAKRRFAQFARAWASYLDIDWEQYLSQLYPQAVASGAVPGLQRVAMPTMPFVTQSYWVDGETGQDDAVTPTLHPLIDANESTLSAQRYLKTFTGEEFYLRDHLIGVDGPQKVLPGVAYLEMARACGSLSMDADLRVHRLRNIMWVQPVTLQDAPQPVYVELEQREDSVEFQIVSRVDGASAAGEESLCTHCQGDVHYLPAGLSPGAETLDIDALKDAAIAVENRARIYADFEQMGYAYGPAYQVTDTRYRMAGAALCRLVLPDHLAPHLERFILHPSLLDAALRTCFGIGAAEAVQPVPLVPFSLEEIEIRGPLPAECYTYATPVDDGDGALRKYNLTVTDTQGRVLVKLTNFAAREWRSSGDDRGRLHYFGYRWQDSPVGGQAPLTATDTVLIVSDDDELTTLVRERVAARVVNVGVADGFESRGADNYALNPASAADLTALAETMLLNSSWPTHILLAPRSGLDRDDARPPQTVSAADLAPRLDASVYPAVALFQALERTHAGQKTRCVFAYPGRGDAVYPEYDGLSGLANSLLVTNHRFELTALNVVDPQDKAAFVDALIAELTRAEPANGAEIRCRDGARSRRCVRRIEPQAATAPVTKPGGVYLITGGTGKLGLLFARHLAATCQAKLILVGRSPLRDAHRSAIAALEELGAEVIYRAVDVGDPARVEALVAEAKQRYGRLDGILHSAGVADATPITALTRPAFANTLVPKLDGVVNLDAASRDEALDFFVCFSSVSALLGDLGAGSYAYANRFMDSFAELRERARALGERSGITVSINWPLWATGGMQIPEAEIAFFNFSGIAALSEEQGLEAFESALRAGVSQLVVAGGDPRKIARTFKVDGDRAPAGATVRSQRTTRRPALEPDLAQPASTVGASAGGLLGATIDYLKRQLAPVIIAEPDEIDAEATFESLGMDSVMMMEMQDSLKDGLERVPKTAMFEYDSVGRLAGFLVRTEADSLAALLGGRFAEDAGTAVGPQVTLLHGDTQQLHRAAAALPRPKSFSTSLEPRTGAGGSTRHEPIAVVGLSGRFPRASDMDEFWEIVQSGRNCIEAIPSQRWDADRYYSKQQRPGGNTASSKWGGFITGVEMFEPEFFRMSMAEAERADPQIRVLLETAWEALEDAAYTPRSLADRIVGTYIGAMNEDFTWVASEIYARTGEYAGPGTVASELANRLSFAFDFKGPSVTVQTACSSSTTAIHMARMAILGGECDMAIAGGVNLSLHHAKYLLLEEMKVLSPDAEERTFDESANGMVPSEGVGIVVMKRLSQARADGDHIYGVISGSKISHAGVGAGQYLPNIKVMEETARTCIEQAGVRAEDIGYLECHGTGTELGDPIELKALANALSAGTDKKGYCALGSKANLGHMEAASGVCSLIKVLLAMKHRRLSPCANVAKVNSAIDMNATPFYLPDAAADWAATIDDRHVAGINSFGLGGSTAFLVLESAPSKATDDNVTHSSFDDNIVVCSATNRARADLALQNLVAHFKRAEYARMGRGQFADIAYTTQIGRVHHDYRIAVVAVDAADFVSKAEGYLNGKPARTGRKQAPGGVLAGDTNAGTETAALLKGDEGRQFIDALIGARKWENIATLWIDGADIDWTKLHAGGARRRVALPTYPFDRRICHIDGYLQRTGKRATRSQPALTAINQEPAPRADTGRPTVSDGQWYRSSTESIDLDALIWGDPSTGSSVQHEAALKDYWTGYLGGLECGRFATSVIDAAGSNIAQPGASIASTSYTLTDELIDSLQRFTQAHEVEIETVVIAVWAVLVSRYTKQKKAAFGVARSLQHPNDGNEAQVLAASSDALTDRCAIPLHENTAVRGSIGNWLAQLQQNMLKMHAYGRVPLQRIGAWTGIDPLFDSLLILIDNHETQEAQAAPFEPDLALVPFDIPLALQFLIGGSAIEIAVRAGSTQIAQDTLELLTDQFIALLEGMLSHPERNPAALSLMTRQEYRKRFWKTLETAGDQ